MSDSFTAESAVRKGSTLLNFVDQPYPRIYIPAQTHNNVTHRLTFKCIYPVTYETSNISISITITSYKDILKEIFRKVCNFERMSFQVK